MDLLKIAGNKNLYEEVSEFDLIDRIKPLLRGGFRFRMPDGKITTNYSFVYETPWISITRDPDRDCMLWHQVLFRYLEAFPSWCLNCWKVVARPNTFHEFAQLHDLMVEWGFSSKIGIEVRAYVQALFGAYFYCNSHEMGLERLEFVRGEIHKLINPDIDVHLKRYCTEFEIAFGASDKMIEVSERDKKWEQIVEDAFDRDQLLKAETPTIIRHHTLRNIIEYAAKMKDPTVKEYNDGEVPMPKIVKYEPGSKDPQDLLRERLAAEKHGGD